MEIKTQEELKTWQNNVIAKILSEKEGIYTICLPRRHGKTRMLLQLAEALKPVHVITTGTRSIGVFEPYIDVESSILLVDEVEHVSKVIDYSKYKLVIQTSAKPQPNSVNFEIKIKE
jgi:predicted AAA+ superfamily ATPase